MMGRFWGGQFKETFTSHPGDLLWGVPLHWKQKWYFPQLGKVVGYSMFWCVQDCTVKTLLKIPQSSVKKILGQMFVHMDIL